MQKILLLAIILINFFFVTAVNAGELLVAGWVENVTLVSSSSIVKAKLDTGAKTSSIHAQNIKTLKKKGRDWVVFDMPLDNDEMAHFSSPIVRTVLIKRHNLPSARRVVVALPICMNGEFYEAEFTLSNRENYNYPILLGRSFLKHKFVINPAKKFRLKQSSVCVNQKQ